MNALLSNVVAGILSSLLFLVMMRIVAINWEWLKRLSTKWTCSSGDGEERADGQPTSTIVPVDIEMGTIDMNMQFTDPTSGIDSEVATGSVDNETTLTRLAAPTGCAQCSTPATHLVERTHSTSDSDMSTSDPGKRSDVNENAEISGVVLS